MKFKNRAQSTAEYAIALGLVIAVAAGVTQVILKGAMKDKQKQAIGYLMDAGNDEAKFKDAQANAPLYGQEVRKTVVDKSKYLDETIMEKGGKELKQQQQKTKTDTVSIETINTNYAGGKITD